MRVKADGTARGAAKRQSSDTTRDKILDAATRPTGCCCNSW